MQQLCTPIWASAVIMAALSIGCSHQQGQVRSSPYPQATPAAAQVSPLEVVHNFNDQYPVGVAVTPDNRIFVCYPRWQDPVRFTVGEIRNGQEVPYPSQEMNTPDSPEHFFSVQNVRADGRGRLWVLGTGNPNMTRVKEGYPKLVAIDLGTNSVAQTIHFPSDVVLANTYLNAVRFDFARGPAGTAYISDSAPGGPNAIIVVDLDSGRSIRRLRDHESVRGNPLFSAIVEGKPVALQRTPTDPPGNPLVGVDGITLSPDGKRLYYCPLSSSKLYSVSTDALVNMDMSDDQVAQTILQEDRDFASDDLESDSAGRIYLTDWEHNAIIIRQAPGEYRTLVTDPRLWWPDTMQLTDNGYLYVTATQLHRLPNYNAGQDLRIKPYQLFRIKVDAVPARDTR